MVELFIYLAEPCHVCQLLLTISHGADDSTFPSTVDVRTGCTLDGLKLVLEVCFTSYIHLGPSKSYILMHCNLFCDLQKWASYILNLEQIDICFSFLL